MNLREELKNKLNDPLLVGDGWLHLINAFDMATRPFFPKYKVKQIKEKFGSLRIYVALGEPSEDLSPDEAKQRAADIYDAIEEIENQSLRVCEVCGQPGRVRGNGMVKTLCAQHQVSNGRI